MTEENTFTLNQRAMKAVDNFYTELRKHNDLRGVSMLSENKSNLVNAAVLAGVSGLKTMLQLQEESN